ncbi:MAG: uncharacterized protein KVP18_003711 [Porospora cf. gigantea A]|uniref:uncharacterized protein n=1 Tax=Porospora cf. gigantea A TaxID=2853593 RepID=UPI0035599E71|nr:MAG: hypothetical protein KVP18_003711 [Porospora cf. gigantea A]
MGNYCNSSRRKRMTTKQHRSESSSSEVAESDSREEPTPPSRNITARRRLSLAQCDPVLPGSRAVDTDDHQRGTISLNSAENQVSPQSRKPSGSVASGAEASPPARRRRLSIGGMVTQKQFNFDNKEINVKCNIPFVPGILQEIGVGTVCKKGMKPESPNQDDFYIIEYDQWRMFGVFDGHGPSGHDVSNFVQRHLPKIFVSNPAYGVDDKKCLADAFLRTHELLAKKVKYHEVEFDANLSGTTATVVHHQLETNVLTCAHVGDSRCVMGVRGPKGNIFSRDLSIDHKPERPEETARIVAAGGEVKHLSGDIPHRVFLKQRMFPGLAMSRALGDLMAHTIGVTSVADIYCAKLSENDLFIIIASDGLWEFTSSEEAVQVVAEHGRANAQTAAELLSRDAWRRWVTEEGNVVDDITVCVVWFTPQES